MKWCTVAGAARARAISSVCPDPAGVALGVEQQHRAGDPVGEAAQRERRELAEVVADGRAPWVTMRERYQFRFGRVVQRRVQLRVHRRVGGQQLGPDVVAHPRPHALAEVVLHRVADQPGQAVLPARAARGEVAGEAAPEQDQGLRVDTVLLHQPVHDRGEHGLEVVPERQSLLVEDTALPGALERQRVHPVRERHRCAVDPARLGRRVVAGRHEHRRAGDVVVGRAEQVAVQRGGPVRDPHGAGLAVHQRDRRPERVAVTAVRRVQRRGREVVAAVEERLPVVLGGPQVGLARADPVPAGGRRGGLGGDRVPGRGPLPVPGAEIAGGDPPGRRERLAEVGAVRDRRVQRAAELTVEVGVVEEDRGHRSGPSSRQGICSTGRDELDSDPDITTGPAAPDIIRIDDVRHS